MKPDESLFRAHLGEAPFQSGVDASKWGLHGDAKGIVWPHAVIWVRADKLILAACRIYLRFNLEGYPAQPPTSCPWDAEKSARLDGSLWPRLTGQFAKVFRLDWSDGTALYAPCDRVAMPGHEVWQKQFPFWWWRPEFTIVKYLDFVHLCLNPYRDENPQT